MNHVDLKKVRELKAIKYIEPDQVVHATLPRKKSENDVGRVRIPEDGHETTDGRVHIPEEGNENQGEHMTVPEDGSEVQASPPWGLARVSHELKPDFTRVNDYWYNQNDGLGVDVYVVDTGINIKHVEFQGRAVWGATIPDGDKDEDGNGHGTHVAGTISAKTFGVAKKANTVAVKVLRSNGSGSMSDVLKGIEWVAKDHVQKNQGEDSIQAPAPYKRTGNKKSVANMSLGGGKSDALDRAVDGAVSVGVHFAVAAGNDNADACNISSCLQKVCTVLATTINDDRATFPTGAMFQILSTWIGSNTANNTISGTSMASPHVAGVIAAYVSRVDSGWDTLTPAQLKLKLINVAVKNVIKGMPKGSGTKNFLVYNSAPVHEHESVSKKGDGESL
ncbi:subtilisin-like protein [Rhizoclosmatium globosum]|uniref:Subtilisin-like protein n=1 Tax=Rhizoclosmatium globosum TaxID=329046 RepID=A0A1Y2CF19_9FUNG|nr:subtilisin-like protein [Rhizoclosmatium globosum]|eukprot:ORY45622.1 subtilisin-like protein [Rhizoclosmatium globosum]